MEPGLGGANIRCGTMELWAGERRYWGLTPTGPWMSVEQAALKSFEELGWEGYHREGGLILCLIKACSFAELPAHRHSILTEAIYANNVRKPFDVRAMNIGSGVDPDTPPSAAIAEWNRLSDADRVDPAHLVESIKYASEERIRNNFQVMSEPPARLGVNFPHLTLD